MAAEWVVKAQRCVSSLQATCTSNAVSLFHTCVGAMLPTKQKWIPKFQIRAPQNHSLACFLFTLEHVSCQNFMGMVQVCGQNYRSKNCYTDSKLSNWVLFRVTALSLLSG